MFGVVPCILTEKNPNKIIYHHQHLIIFSIRKKCPFLDVFCYHVFCLFADHTEERLRLTATISDYGLTEVALVHVNKAANR